MFLSSRSLGSASSVGNLILPLFAFCPCSTSPHPPALITLPLHCFSSSSRSFRSASALSLLIFPFVLLPSARPLLSFSPAILLASYFFLHFSLSFFRLKSTKLNQALLGVFSTRSEPKIPIYSILSLLCFPRISEHALLLQFKYLKFCLSILLISPQLFIDYQSKNISPLPFE